MSPRYPERPGWLGGGDLSENGSIYRMGLPSSFWGSLVRGCQAARVDPMRQMLPFSLRSSPPSHPGRSGYLRGMLYNPRQVVTPLGGRGAGARSRAISTQSRLHPQ